KRGSEDGHVQRSVGERDAGRKYHGRVDRNGPAELVQLEQRVDAYVAGIEAKFIGRGGRNGRGSAEGERLRSALEFRAGAQAQIVLAGSGAASGCGIGRRIIVAGEQSPALERAVVQSQASGVES